VNRLRVGDRENADRSGGARRDILPRACRIERELIRERVRSGIAAARARGKRVGRPRRAVDAVRVRALRTEGRSWRQIARELGVGAATARAALPPCSKNPADEAPENG
jgi:DNA invertase Pin-like site-specific DNA recombinase